jgi:ribosomal protein L11 methyltransferase
MPCYEIEFPLGSLNSDAVEDALFGLGASSITLVDRGDEPVLEPKPGEIRLWSDTLVRALFEESAVPHAAPHSPATAAILVLKGLSDALGPQTAHEARVRAVADRDWERVWLKDWKSMRFGRRLWVCPTAADLPDDPDAVVVRLDPGLAFGTGTHPTTALCLQVLDSLTLTARSVIDYGCGSGILGIAALKLGAATVTAVDIDPQALTATRENAARNGLAARMLVQNSGSLPSAHVVMANILAGPLIELAPLLTAACEADGHLLLSGLLRTQAYAVKAAYAAGFDKVRLIERDGWCCIHARKVA